MRSEGPAARGGQRPFRVGVCAEAFGFGPASKAAAIVAGLKREARVQPVALAHSIAYEFLEREGIGGADPVDIRTPAGRRRGEELAADLDLALVVLIPEWVPVIPPGVPVVYVDSLGFLWPREYFDEHEALREVAAYVVQEVFSAADRLRRFGVRNVRPVGALTPNLRPAEGPRFGDLVHLGGLLNIFCPEDGFRYAEATGRLLEGIVPAGTTVLLSEAVRARHPDVAGLVEDTLSHDRTMKRFASAACIFTSPGMTALLELTALGTPVVPLPPQNLSQARIVAEVATLPGVPDVWRMLASSYPVEQDVPEAEGVAMVRRWNREHATSATFRETYRRLARKARQAARPLPDALVRNHRGLEECVAILRGLLVQAREAQGKAEPRSRPGSAAPRSS